MFFNSNKDPNQMLLLSCQEGNYDAVLSSLNLDADIETLDKRKQTPLILAAYGGHTNIVELLIRKGANIEAKRDDESNALLRAVYNKNFDVIKLLIDNGANIEVTDRMGNNVAHIAAYLGYDEILEYLISNYADFNAKNNEGLTPLMLAKDSGSRKTIYTLSSNPSVNKEDEKPGREKTILGPIVKDYVFLPFIDDEFKGQDIDWDDEKSDDETKTPGPSR